MSPSRRDDTVEVVLKRADAKLEEWFRRGQKATRKASMSFGAFLRQAKGQSAGALRHEVDDLQAGLKKLSTRLDRVEHEATTPRKPGTHEISVAPKRRRARPAAAPKAAKSSKAASVRKRKKAA